MSSETPGPAPAPPPPPSDGHASDHDSSGDENERFGSFSAVQVVKVAAAPSTTASSAEHSPAVSDAATSGHASGQVEPVKSPQDELKFKIACMPILRLKVCLAPAASIFPKSPLLISINVFFSSHQSPTFTLRCSRPRAAERIFSAKTRSVS